MSILEARMWEFGPRKMAQLGAGKRLPQGDGYVRPAQKVPGRGVLPGTGRRERYTPQTTCDALACCASPRGTLRLVWLSVSISPAYLTSCSHHGPSWLGKMLGSSRWSQPTMGIRGQVRTGD